MIQRFMYMKTGTAKPNNRQDATDGQEGGLSETGVFTYLQGM